MSFISWMAQARFFSELPRTSAGTQSSVRASRTSRTSWPTRWFEIAQHFRPYLAEQVVALLAVAVVLEGLLDVEVIAPAGELDAVVAPLAGLLADDLQGQVGPLAGEERDGAGHRACGLPGVWRRSVGVGGNGRNHRRAGRANVNDLTRRSRPADNPLARFARAPTEARPMPPPRRALRLRRRDRRHRERPRRRLAADLRPDGLGGRRRGLRAGRRDRRPRTSSQSSSAAGRSRAATSTAGSGCKQELTESPCSPTPRGSIPGSRELVARPAERASGSRSSRRPGGANVEVVLGAVGPGGAFELIVGKEDVTAVKPDPDAYRPGPRSAWSSRPVEAVALEDSPTGLRRGPRGGGPRPWPSGTAGRRGTGRAGIGSWPDLTATAKACSKVARVAWSANQRIRSDDAIPGDEPGEPLARTASSGAYPNSRLGPA